LHQSHEFDKEEFDNKIVGLRPSSLIEQASGAPSSISKRPSRSGWCAVFR
jgi:hypothetical protein